MPDPEKGILTFSIRMKPQNPVLVKDFICNLEEDKNTPQPGHTFDKWIA